MITSAVLDVLTAECLAESPKNYTYRCALAVMTIFMFLRNRFSFKVYICNCNRGCAVRVPK